MKTIIKTTYISCTLEELFSFHMDTKNIKHITPQNVKIEILDDDTTTYEGKVVNIKTTKFFIPMHWKVMIDKIESPTIIIDRAAKSPFKSWKHQHIFTQKGSVCELKDIIEYELPFGFLGKIISPFIEYDIVKMFEYRHKQTKILLEPKKNDKKA